MDVALRSKIQSIIDEHRIMSIATLRPDGWPQVTTVGYANVGMTLYFLCGLNSQKAMNLAKDPRVSLTIDHDTADLMSITGLSMAAYARRITDAGEAHMVLELLPRKYPEVQNVPWPMPRPEEVALFRVEPKVISVLDYAKGFAHTDLVEV